MALQQNQFGRWGRAPGVHFEEMAPRVTAAFKTGVPLIIGFGQPIGQHDDERTTEGQTLVYRITSWEQFDQCVRVHLKQGYLDYAVRGFFDNGGERCVVVSLNTRSQEGEAMSRALAELFAPFRGPLEDITDTDLVCVPDIMAEPVRNLPDGVQRFQQIVLEYCRHMNDRFAILDSEPVNAPTQPGQSVRVSSHPDQAVEQILRRRRVFKYRIQGTEISPDTAFGQTFPDPADGALYFPWLCVKPLPRHQGAKWVIVPPSGHIAGIYARSDVMYGVHKAPANEVVEGIEDLDTFVSDDAQADLNQRGINCLRSFPGRGIRIWGARTLSDRPDWRYISVRRLFVTLVRWIDRNMNDLVFEPNEPPLWGRVRDRLGAYCYRLFQHGALKGSRPAEAFFVKCDAETNPIEARKAGQLICEVGLAPVVPAEFIIVRITQNPSGTTLFQLTV